MKKYIKYIRKEIALQVLFSGLYTAAIACFPYLRKLLFDHDYAKGYAPVFGIVGAYLLLILLNAIFQIIAQTYEWKVDYGFSKAIRSDYFRSIIARPFAAFKKQSPTEYVSVVDNDISLLEEHYIEAIIDIIKSITMLAVYTTFMLVFVDGRITLVIIAASLAAVFVPRITASKLSHLRKEYQGSLGKYLAKFEDLLQGYHAIARATRPQIERAHEESLLQTEGKRLMYGKFRTKTNVLNGLVMDFISLAAFVAVAVLLTRGEITLGTGVATFGYIESFIYPIKYIINDINNIHATKEIKERVLETIGETYPDKVVLDGDIGTIALCDVEIQQGDFSLTSFSYTFESGKKYALVGHSGSGKSTLLSLLAGHLLPNKGSITIAGQDASTLDISAFVHYQEQSAHMYADTFANNATVYHSYALNRVTQAATCLAKSAVGPMIQRMVGQSNAALLSGGEQQALHLLRAYASSAPVLLLDEPFSALDKENAPALFDQLLGGEATLIMATHDHSADFLKRFDAILVFEHGQLKVYGAYEQVQSTLLAQNQYEL